MPQAELRALHPKPSQRVESTLGDLLAHVLGNYEGQRMGHKIGGALTTIIPVDAPGDFYDASQERMKATRNGDWLATKKAELKGMLNAAALIPGARVAKGMLSKLPMSVEARMGRAADMGFDTGKRLYHGTSDTFGSFEPGNATKTTGAPSAQVGVWSSSSPKVAAEYADAALKSRGGDWQILPLLHRPGKPALLRLQGGETDRDVAATLADAFESGGYDSVVVSHPNRADEVVVKTPSQLRSIHAAFDPAKKGSSDLLAGIGAGAGAGLAASLLAGQQTPRKEPTR